MTMVNQSSRPLDIDVKSDYLEANGGSMMFKLANHLMFETTEEKNAAKVILTKKGYAPLIEGETEVAFRFRERKIVELMEEILSDV